MTERQLQFRVGLFVLVALLATGALAVHFGELDYLWNPRYSLIVKFDQAAGVSPATPVLKNGLMIGEVRKMELNTEDEGVLVTIDIQQQYRIRKDAKVQLEKGLLGGASLRIVAGTQDEWLQEGDFLQGTKTSSLTESVSQTVENMEHQLTRSLDAFVKTSEAFSETSSAFLKTSEEWTKVGSNINHLLTHNQKTVENSLVKSVEALDQFMKTTHQAHSVFHEATKAMMGVNQTISQVNHLVGDPEMQRNIKQTLASLPGLVNETQGVIQVARKTVEQIDQNFENLEQVTSPLAGQSAELIGKLNHSLTNLESISTELSHFTDQLNSQDGSLQRLASDPTLYRNLNTSAAGLAITLENLQPFLRDLSIFGDKIARHPELLGIRGAIRGSSGLKYPPPKETSQAGMSSPRYPTSRVRQTGTPTLYRTSDPYAHLRQKPPEMRRDQVIPTSARFLPPVRKFSPQSNDVSGGSIQSSANLFQR